MKEPTEMFPKITVPTNLLGTFNSPVIENGKLKNTFDISEK